ncbi:hypothetical protein ABSA28_00564 [Candidatus Hepatincolaceae symbiont of Richtersius coronifer]
MEENLLLAMKKEDIARFLGLEVKELNTLLWNKKITGVYKLNKYKYLVDKKELIAGLTLKNKE